MHNKKLIYKFLKKGSLLNIINNSWNLVKAIHLDILDSQNPLTDLICFQIQKKHFLASWEELPRNLTEIPFSRIPIDKLLPVFI